MSSTITVYRVHVDQVKQAIGSHDLCLINHILHDAKYFLSSIDKIDGESELTCGDAVARLINGEARPEGSNYLYGYALEAICAHIGDELPGICPIARASAWLDEIDAKLESLKVPVGLHALVFRGSPVPIPEPDECPCIGQWTAAEVVSALAAFLSLDLSGEDWESAETLKQIQGWLAEAAKTRGASVIGFLS